VRHVGDVHEQPESPARQLGTDTASSKSRAVSPSIVTGGGSSNRSRAARSLGAIARAIFAAATRTSSGNSRRSACRRATT
jgi:hypothetical protein